MISFFDACGLSQGYGETSFLSFFPIELPLRLWLI